MSKDIQTVPGVSYTVTMTQAGTVHAQLDCGTQVLLEECDQPGQVTFQAISSLVVVSDDDAVVLPFKRASVAGSGGGGVSADEVESVVHGELYTTESIISSTPTGTDNAGCNYIVLAAARTFEGELTSISYRTATNTTGGMTTAPLYLAVWEPVAEGSPDYEFVGISTDAITQSTSKTLTWHFDNLRLHGRGLKLIPTTDKAVTDSTSAILRIRTSASTDGTVVVSGSSSHSYTPQMELAGLRYVPRFAEVDEIESLTEGQKNVLACFEWDTTYGLSLIHMTDGVIDGRLRVMVNSGTVNLVSGYPVTLQAAQVGVVSATEFHTKTDTSTGVTYNFSGHTLSTTEMQAYGITEPCVWCGDPLLPLLLRGSEIRLNGTVLDVAKLVQVLAKADELLALVAAEAAEDGGGDNSESSEEQ